MNCTCILLLELKKILILNDTPQSWLKLLVRYLGHCFSAECLYKILRSSKLFTYLIRSAAMNNCGRLSIH